MYSYFINIIWSFFSGNFIFFQNGTTYVIYRSVLAALCAFLVYICYLKLDKLKIDSPINTKKETKEQNDDSNDSNMDLCLSLLKDCLAYKYTDNYPILEKEVNQTFNYLETFKLKNYKANSYIINELNKFLLEYKEVVTTPVKDTDQGRSIISQIEESLKLINETLGKIYKAILEDKENEITFMVEGLKKKLTWDGFLQDENSVLK